MCASCIDCKKAKRLMERTYAEIYPMLRERHTRQIVVMTWIFRNGDRSMNITSAAEAASKLEKRERKNRFIAMKDKNLELLCASRFA